MISPKPHDREPAPDEASALSSCPNSGPSIMDLAAFFDGTLSQDLRESIDRHVASCPVCQEAIEDLIQARSDERETLPLVPAHVLAAAMGLVPEAVEAPIPLIRAHWSTRGFNWGFTWSRRAVAAAAVIGISLAGHALGRAMSATGGDESNDSLESLVSFGLIDQSNADSSSGDSDALSFGMTEALQ